MCSPPPVRVTYEQYIEMLEVLPPEHWVQTKESSSFQCLEHMSGRVTAAYCRIGSDYFALMVIEGTPHETIVQRCLHETKQ